MKPLQWWPESFDLPEENPSGARIRCLTSAPTITHNLYCEQPYCSADGNRLALFRTGDSCPWTPGDLLVYDIERYRVARISTQANGIGYGIRGVANASWSGVLFVVVEVTNQKRLMRFDLNTLESADLFDWSPIPGYGLFTVSGDHRCGLASAMTGEVNAAGRPFFGIYRVDLTTGAHQLIHQSLEIVNPHLQFRLNSASRIMVQENRGCEVDGLGNLTRACDERGVGLYSIASDGGDRRDFPVGPPFIAATTGHECWVGDTDRVLVTLTAPYDDGKRRGNVVEVSHDWPKPRVVFDSPHVWNHISASRCGRFFVTDCYQLPGVPIMVGCIESGQTAILCESKTTGGGAQYSHAHPYLTSENRHVVFNSDRTGLPQVYIASVPEGLLESLLGSA